MIIRHQFDNCFTYLAYDIEVGGFYWSINSENEKVIRLESVEQGYEIIKTLYAYHWSLRNVHIVKQ